MSTDRYNVIGLMSGTSCDGLDICDCIFEFDDEGKCQYDIRHTRAVTYPDDLQSSLKNAITLSAYELSQLSWQFGSWCGQKVKEFINEHNSGATLVASHGHTVFHQPQRGLTLQIGNGAAIYGKCGLPVVCDFRSLDVALGGQGAPLVPIGDQLLFGEYDFCLNLGGFSNCSYELNGNRAAYDICAVNIVLNHLSEMLGKTFDRNGDMARSGKVIPALLDQLTSISYYIQKPPKSLGLEWVKEIVFPITDGYSGTADVLHTYCIHISKVMANDLIARKSKRGTSKVLVTGGGAMNGFLMELMSRESAGKLEMVIPDQKLIDYKEALIFALLGVLRVRNEVNTLKSVTGASADSCGGAIYGRQ